MRVDWVTTAFVLFALLPTMIFTVMFALRSRWRQSSLGTLLLVKSMIFSVILGYALLSHLAPDLPARRVIGVIVYLLIGIVFWTQLVLLLKAQSHQHVPERQFEGHRSREREDDRRRTDR